MEKCLSRRILWIVCLVVFPPPSLSPGSPFPALVPAAGATEVPPSAEGYILVSNRKTIRLIELSQKSSRIKSHILIQGLKNAAAVDFHYRKGLICWSDFNEETIRCAKLKGNSVISTYAVVPRGMVSPDGIAIDWVNDKIYWNDLDSKRLEVAELDGRDRTVLYWEGLDQPRAIALVPEEGILFWTDWGQTPKIERGGMDGDRRSRRVIVGKDIQWPNGLAVDLSTRKLYWTDGRLQMLSSMDFNGNGRRDYFQRILQHPFALSVMEGRIFWTDWTESTVETCSVHDDNCTSRRSILKDAEYPMGVRFWSEKAQPLPLEHTPPPPGGATPCSEDNGGCSNLCLAAPSPLPHVSNASSFSCACPTGVAFRSSKVCNVGPQKFLLLARRKDVRRISLDTPDYTGVVVQASGIKHMIAVDYDPHEQMVYWTDEELHCIRRSPLNGTGAVETVLSEEINHPDGLALDTIGRNLYWTDTGTDRIEVVRLDGRARKILIHTDLDQPRALALDPPEGVFFWTDWGENPRVERANLDGSGRRMIVKNGLGWPNGIALDTRSKEVYWADALHDKIEMCTYDGKHRQVLLDRGLQHPFGFTLLGDDLFWSDWQSRRVEKVDKRTGKGRTIIAELLPDLMGLAAVDLSAAPGWTPCVENDGGCSHLCLALPPEREGGRASHTCECPLNMEMTGDNKTCGELTAFLILPTGDQLRRISVSGSLNRSSHHQTSVLPISGLREVVAVSYDTDEQIYWTDVESKTVTRAYINGSGVQNIAEFGLEYPEGIAVDWHAGNVYWADVVGQRIEVSLLNGDSRRVIVWKNLDSPRSLAVDPIEGFLFFSLWSQSHNPRIERSSLAGNPRVILHNNLGRVNGLTVHLSGTRRRLFWVDIDYRRIQSSDMNGIDLITHLRISDNDPMMPFGLAVYKDSIYFTDHSLSNSTSIYELPIKDSTASPKLLRGRIPIHPNVQGTDLLLYSKYKEPAQWNPCSTTDRGRCQHLCFFIPGAQDPESATRVCACPTHYTLNGDGRTCSPPSSGVFVSQKGQATRLVLSSPIGKEESPKAILPIPGFRHVRSIAFSTQQQILYWIDGKTKAIKHAFENGTHLGALVPASNAGTSSDEDLEFLEDTHNPFDLAFDPINQMLLWSCSSRDIVNVTSCRPESDGLPLGTIVGGRYEEDSGPVKPRQLAFHYLRGILFWVDISFPDAVRIRRTLLDGSDNSVILDGRVEISALAVDVGGDLLFWSEERSLHVSDLHGKGKKTMPHFTSLTLFSPIALAVEGNYLYWADRERQTVERIDKSTGESRETILQGMGQLTDLSGAEPWVGVGVGGSYPKSCPPDCSHFCLISVSVCACPQGMSLAEDAATCIHPPSCPVGKFSCSSGTECILDAYRCDGTKDCADGSDERACSTCPTGHFRCHNGQCIQSRLHCDGTPHCLDRSDESCCGKNKFPCRWSADQCINLDQVCDGSPQCLDESDEGPEACSVLQNSLKDESLKSAGGDGVGSDASIPPSGHMTSLIASLVVFGLVMAALAFALRYYNFTKRSSLPPQSNLVVDATGVIGTSGLPLQAPHTASTMAGAPPLLLMENSIGFSHRNFGSGPTYASVPTNSTLLPPSISMTPTPFTRPSAVGASSTNSSSSGPYVAGVVGPPPSPATASSPHSSTCPSSQVKDVAHSYRYYKSRNRPPPPTPCSTDACESDYGALGCVPSRASAASYYGPVGHHLYHRHLCRDPPPTPRSPYLSDTSDYCPPSPITERSFHGPLPPPPSRYHSDDER
ncbi:unnamed protein product [Cyprideis torosa]|uniref:Uncharacterized protein n=1 Tax=Cyprideis torosa TaxID=163714 RepID=A0A7R8W9W5_9CRUS|nr:unnamed protein product [Cyprideis torosa]CAG0887744.1 unnamed protein product [Cyprideis torosa]